MTWKMILPATAIALSACATIVDEQSTPTVVQSGPNAGKSYTTRQRTLDGPQGTYEQTSVVYRENSIVCRIESPGDCERAAEALINNYSSGTDDDR